MIESQICPKVPNETKATILSTCYYSSLDNSPYGNRKYEIQNVSKLKKIDSANLIQLNEYRREIDQLQQELYQTQKQVYQVKKLLIQLKFKNDHLTEKIAAAEAKLSNINPIYFSSRASSKTLYQDNSIKTGRIKKSFSNVVRLPKRSSSSGVKKTTRTNLIVYEKVGTNIQNILIDRSSSLYHSISISVSQSFNITNEIHTKCAKKPKALSRFIEFFAQKNKN